MGRYARTVLLIAVLLAGARAAEAAVSISGSVNSTTTTSIRTTSTSFWSEEPDCGNWQIAMGIENASAPLGRLFFRIQYSASGSFVGEPVCTGTLEGPRVVSSDVRSKLVVGFFSDEAVPEGTTFAHCLFYGYHSERPKAGHFKIVVDHASDLDGQPVVVTPSLTVTPLTPPEQCEERCGDGIVASLDECDDGNTLDVDSCVACRWAVCGDGAVRSGVEACDDGDRHDFDDCPRSCVPAWCGDGYVRIGTELCDDGNTVGSDDCDGCVPAKCGDGVVGENETCDDGGTVAGDGCSRHCAAERSCGNPIADGEIQSSDSLIVLRSSVGIDVDCPSWACDVNSSGTITAADALAVLRRSILLDVSLACVRPSAVLLRLSGLGQNWNHLRSLRVMIDYSAADGEVVGEGTSVECEAVDPRFSASFEDDDEASVLEIEAETEHLDLRTVAVARCRFSSPGFWSDDFRVPVLEAKRPDGSRIPGFVLEVIPD